MHCTHTFLDLFFTTLTVRILECHYDHWIHHATTVSHTLENLQDVVGVHDGCPGACRQSRRRTGRRGSADELIAPLTTSDLLFCRFPHNNTLPYTSQKDHLQHLPHEFYTSNPAIKVPKRSQIVEQPEDYQNSSTASAISSTKTKPCSSRWGIQTSKQCLHDFQCAISELL